MGVMNINRWIKMFGDEKYWATSDLETQLPSYEGVTDPCHANICTDSHVNLACLWLFCSYTMHNMCQN